LHDQDRGASRRLEISDVLDGHHSSLGKQPAKTGRMASSGACVIINAKPARVFEPIEQREQIGRRGRFRVPSQPGEARPPQRRIEDQQIFQRLSRCIGQPFG